MQTAQKGAEITELRNYGKVEEKRQSCLSLPPSVSLPSSFSFSFSLSPPPPFSPSFSFSHIIRHVPNGLNKIRCAVMMPEKVNWNEDNQRAETGVYCSIIYAPVDESETTV